VTDPLPPELFALPSYAGRRPQRRRRWSPRRLRWGARCPGPTTRASAGRPVASTSTAGSWCRPALPTSTSRSCASRRPAGRL